MPQLNLANYNPQIFWFVLCFIVLYFFISRVILPRIFEIIEARERIIKVDLADAEEIDQKIHQIQIITENLKKDANHKYQTKLEEASKKAEKNRDEMIEEFKEKFEQIAIRSRQELKEFIEKSGTKSDLLTEDLIKRIKQKFFSVIPNK